MIYLLDEEKRKNAFSVIQVCTYRYKTEKIIISQTYMNKIEVKK